MFDKIITVTLNPALDVTLWLDTMDFVEPNEAAKEVVYAGGKGVNIARVMSSLGVQTKALGICGNENAKRLYELLEKDGVTHDFVEVDGAVRENLTLNIPDGRFLKINRKGCPVSVDALRRLRAKIDAEIQGTNKALLVFAGSLPPNVTPEGYKAFLSSFRRENVAFALDNAFFRLSDVEEVKPFLIKPNLVEFRRMSGSDLRTEQSIIKLSRSVADYVEHVLVSLGPKGLIYAGPGGSYRLHPLPVRVKSTVGAGDTVVAAFLCALQKGLSDVDAVAYAVAAGSASVTLEGTEVVTPGLVASYLNQVTAKAIR